jgi:hypothetical protein
MRRVDHGLWRPPQVKAKTPPAVPVVIDPIKGKAFGALAVIIIATRVINWACVRWMIFEPASLDAAMM